MRPSRFWSVLSFSLIASVSLTAALTRAAELPPSANECFQCHDDRLIYDPVPVADPAKRKKAHEPVVTEGCLLCHYAHTGETETALRNMNPANNPNPAFLRKPINTLCLGCHRARALNIVNGRGHIIDDHPLKGFKDPVYPEKELSCASCHNPHASAQEKLIRYDASVQPYAKWGLCAVCHYEKTIGSKPVPPPWTDEEH